VHSSLCLGGASIATPYTTGMAAHVILDSPDLLSTPTTLNQVLLDTGKPVPDIAGKTGTGKMVETEALPSPRVTAVAPKPGTIRFFQG